MNLLKIPRIKAALIHLAISAFVAALALGLVFKVWYPAPWADALGVGKIFLIVLGVDLCLGPLLTLVVFKVGKASLRNDLMVIACIQIAALLYGMHTVGLGRPVYLVFIKNHFELAAANEVYTVKGAGKTVDLLELNPWAQPLTGPVTVFAKESDDLELRNQLVFSSAGGGPDTHNVKDFYLPYSQALPSIIATAKTLGNYELKLPAKKQALATLKEKYPHSSFIVAVKVRSTLLIAILNPTDGAILGIEPVDIFE